MGKVSSAHLDARRHGILNAACDVFAKKGVEAATMAEIASKAGISPGAIYRYYPSKEELARACMDTSGDAIYAQWIVPPSEVPSAVPFDQLARATLARLNEPSERMATTLFLERVLSAVFAEDGAGLEELQDQAQTIEAGIAARLAFEVAKGRLPQGLDLQALAGMLYAFYVGARVMKLVDHGPEPQRQLEQILTLFQTGAARSSHIQPQS